MKQPPDPMLENSLRLHSLNHGKIALSVKTPVRDRADLALVYTPGVGAVSRVIAADKSKVWEYTARGNWVAVVSDGSAVLGLGNVGPEAALPVMEGKALLMKELAGVDAFPICLDTQDSGEIIRIVTALAPSFGAINLEDIAAPRCFEIEEALIKKLSIPVFHDDQHGTAIVVLAGLINSCLLTGRQLNRAKITISGAGAAGIAIARLLLAYGISDLLMVDSAGIVADHRTDINLAKRDIVTRAKPHTLTGNLATALKERDIFVGVSAPGIVTGEMIRSMNKNAIVFAMANPIPEIMPDMAKAAGAAIVATGRSDFPNQVNNALAFPGVFKGLLETRGGRVTDKMKLAAAQGLVDYLKKPSVEQILPDVLDKGVVQVISQAIVQNA